MILTDKATRTARKDVRAVYGERDLKPGWIATPEPGVEVFYPADQWQEVTPEIWDDCTVACRWEETTGLFVYQPRVREGMPRPAPVDVTTASGFRVRLHRYPEGHTAFVVEKKR